MIRRVVSTAVAAIVAVIVVALPVSGASAHDSLVSSNPPADTEVDVVPTQIELVFSQTPLGVGAAVQVTGPDGDVVSVDAPQIVDTSVIQPVAEDLPAGSYQVTWRVTSSDGHPISGDFAFTAAQGATSPAATQAPESTPTDSATTTTDGTSQAGHSDSSAWRIALGAGGVLALLGAIVVVVRRLRAAG